MSEHHVKINWERSAHATDPDTYSRDLRLEFGSGRTVEVSAATEYKGNPELADPEQLLVGSVASCHMLFFLAIADFQGYVVTTYSDSSTGILGNGQSGPFLVRIVLRPRISFGGPKHPDAGALLRMHEQAHKKCFIANSIRSEIIVEPAPIPTSEMMEGSVDE